MLDRVHREFRPEELLFVRMVLQNPEADTIKSVEGWFRDAARRDPSVLERELAKLRGIAQDESEATSAALPSSSACVTGFLLNMVQRSVQLISPCPSDERWPLGHYVFDEERFESAADLERVLRSMVARHMLTGAPRGAPARLMDGLTHEMLDDGFRLTSRTEEVEFRSAEMATFLRALGDELRQGGKTPDQLAEWAAARFGVAREDAREAVDAVWAAGALDMEPAPRSAVEAS